MVALADTSIWIDHLRRADPSLQNLIDMRQAAIHPFVIGELAMGMLNDRDEMLGFLQDLPKLKVTEHKEVLAYVTTHSLFGRGIGYIDAHLLVSVQLTAGALLWTRDRRLREVAEELHLGFVN